MEEMCEKRMTKNIGEPSWEVRCFRFCELVNHQRRSRELGLDLDAENLPWFAFSEDLKRAAAYFTVGCEPLIGDSSVDDQFHGLATIRALDTFTFYHTGSIALVEKFSESVG